MATKINNDVYQLVIPTPFLVGPVNVYLIEGEKLTLVDVGPKTDEAWQTLTFELAQLGYIPEDIEQIIITHHHPDHVGLIDYFPTVPIIGHWRNRPWISKDKDFLRHHDEFFRALLKEHGASETFINRGTDLTKSLRFGCEATLHVEVNEGDVAPGLSDWIIYETPGHATSHIVLYREQDGLMIGGDHILKKISSNPLLEPPYPGKETERVKPLLQYRDALQKCIDMKPLLVLAGHGDAVSNVAPLLKQRLKQQEKRAAMVKRWLTEGETSAFELCKRLFPRVYEEQFSLAFSETLGQLDYLENIGAVRQRKEGNVILFEVVQ